MNLCTFTKYILKGWCLYMANYYLPGFAGQISSKSDEKPYEQKAPLYNLYSPRLFGAPPQFTNQCDLRLKSSLGTEPGPVGDWYMDNILIDAQVCNFIVGHARFDGGFSTLTSIMQSAHRYGTALKHYNVFDSNGNEVTRIDSAEVAAMANDELLMEDYSSQLGLNESTDSEEDGEDGYAPVDGMQDAQQELDTDIQAESSAGTTGASDESYAMDVDSIEGADSILTGIASMFKTTGVLGGTSGLMQIFKGANKLQHAFYTFEADWSSYIDNVRMMINSAIVMLGLSDAKVRIGDSLWPINATEKLSKTDVWANYRFITPTSKNGVGDFNAIDTLSGEFNQYVSFMVEPVQIQENYSNQTTESQIYANVIKSGETLGNEIAFLTNTSANMIDDAVINLAGQGINMAEKVMTNLTLGSGKFTAAVLGSMAKSYTGEHTIFPQIFQVHQSTSEVSLNIKLRASAGDPYSYLMEILVPIFHLMAMAIPQMSKSAASAYSYPPLVQINIPGVWGTRLGIVRSLSFTKSGNDFSINGYPLAVDVTVAVTDLQHVIMSSPMSNKSQMLNNDTMFDYIAQCAGVDKYRFNPAIRIVTKLILAASAGENFVHNIGKSVLNWATGTINRMTNNANV